MIIRGLSLSGFLACSPPHDLQAFDVYKPLPIIVAKTLFVAHMNVCLQTSSQKKKKDLRIHGSQQG